jgi:hypothetical protein
MSEENNEDDDAKEQSSLHIVGNGNDPARGAIRLSCECLFAYTFSLPAYRSIINMKVAQRLADVASWQHPSSR